MAQDLIEELRVKINKLEARNKGLARKTQEYEEKLKILNTNDSDALAKKQEEEIRTQLSKEYEEELEKQTAKLTTEIKKLGEQIENSQSGTVDTSALEGELNTKNTQITSLQREVSELKEKVRSSKLPTGDLIADMTQKIDRFKLIVRKQKAELEGLQSLKESGNIVANLEQKIVKTAKDIEARDETIKSQNKSISDLTKKVKKAEKEVAKMEKQIAKLGSKKSDPEKPAVDESMVKELEDSKGKIASLKGKVADLQNELAKEGDDQTLIRVRELRNMINENQKKLNEAHGKINHWKKKAIEAK